MLAEIALVTVTSVVVVLLAAVVRHRLLPRGAPRCVVLVLGDIGRSPRMTYHAEQIAKAMPVDVVAYVETAPSDRLTAPGVTVRALSTLPPLPAMPLRSIVWLLAYGPAKFAHLGLQLLSVWRAALTGSCCSSASRGTRTSSRRTRRASRRSPCLRS